MFTAQQACLAFSSLLVAPVALAQTPVALELGKSVTAELAGGQTHQYTVTAMTRQIIAWEQNRGMGRGPGFNETRLNS